MNGALLLKWLIEDTRSRAEFMRIPAIKAGARR